MRATAIGFDNPEAKQKVGQKHRFPVICNLIHLQLGFEMPGAKIEI